jgi:hypothetical protein
MKYYFFYESSDIICSLDIPFNPRFFCRLLNEDVKVESQTAEAIGNILRPRNL